MIGEKGISKLPTPRYKIGDTMTVYINGKPYPARVYGVTIQTVKCYYQVELMKIPMMQVDESGSIVYQF